MITSYVVYFSWFTFTRHDNLFSNRYDLGHMDQTIWNTSQGRIFTFTNPTGTETISRFAIHTDFFLIFLAPLYWIFPNVKVILFIQSFIVALGAIPVFLLAKKVIKSDLAGLVFSLSYLLYPALERANIYEFHSITMAPTFLLFAFYFAYIKKYGWFFLFSFLASSTKEEIPLAILAIGLYIIFKNKDKLVGLITVFLSLLWFVLAIWIVIPYFRAGAHHFGVSYFSEFGESPEKIILGFIKQPAKVFTTVFSYGRLDYLNQLLLPVGFLSLFSPLLLLFSWSDLSINILSNVSVMQSIYYQYTSGITPFIFISSIFGFSFIIKKFNRIKTFLTFYFLLSTLLGAYFFGPLPFSFKPDFNPIKHLNSNSNNVLSFAKKIPTNSSVSVTHNITPHFTHRENVYSFPVKFNEADYSIVLTEGIYESMPIEEIKKQVVLLKANKNYSLIFEENNFFIFKKNEKNN